MDRTTGLAWTARPSPVGAPWAEASAAAAADGARLPSPAELMRFLGALAAAGTAVLAPDDVLWTASGSPYSRATLVRAIAADPEGRLGVVLRERDAAARWWAVSDPVPTGR